MHIIKYNDILKDIKENEYKHILKEIKKRKSLKYVYLT